jgi:hypothetical protein
MMLIVLSASPTLTAAEGGLARYVILALVIGAIVGGLAGLVGALFGVWLHNVRWWATEDTQ